MKFRRLSLVCECGHAAKSFQSVGFTSEYELVIHWKCTKCGKLAYLVKTLANCCRECPEVEESPDLDAQFLQSMGIQP
jgi:hypothetical protein